MKNGKQKASTAGTLPRRLEYGQPPYSSLNNQPAQQQPEYVFAWIRTVKLKVIMTNLGTHITSVLHIIKVH